MSEPKCYQCKHRGDVPGDAHSCCQHPTIKGNEAEHILAFAFNMEPLGVTADKHGIKNGWFQWPINFDPVWLLTCEAFEEK